MAVLGASASPAGAVPGDLDTAYGDRGVAVVFAGGDRHNSEGRAVAIDPAGSAVVAGFAAPWADEANPDPGPPVLTVTRLTPGGVTDTSFGNGGSTTASVNGSPVAVAVQPDRGVLVLAAGQAYDDNMNVTGSHTYLVRLTPDGRLDASFGAGGVAEVQPAGEVYGESLALGPAGTIVVGGGWWSGAGRPPSPFVARLTAAGAPDSTFGSGGIAALTGAGSVAAIGIAPDGHLMVGVGVDSSMGATFDNWPGFTRSFTVRRVTSAGGIDASFGTGGEATLPLPPTTLVRSLLPLADGSLVAVGALGRQPLVAKFTPAGALDGAFGNRGIVELAVPGTVYDIEISGVLLPDGKILVGGPGGPTGTFLVRLLPTGRPDRTFAAGGIAWPAPLDRPIQMQTGPAVQADGASVFAGVAHVLTQPDGSPAGDQIAALRVTGGSGPEIPPADTATRIAGADRVATAIASSQATFSDWMKPDGVRLGASGGIVLASSESFPDALVAAPFAQIAHVPLLLTPGRALDPRVLAETRRVAGDGTTGGNVVVIGGPAAISENVATAIKAAGYQVQRISGADRYETAAAVADFQGSGIVFETTGLDFGDAIAAGAAAAQVQGAVLLTEGAKQSAATAAYLASAKAVRYAVGGAAAAADTAAAPIVGADRYETAAKVAATFFPTPSAVTFATGASFADALTAGARAALFGAPVLLTRRDELPAPAAAWLTTAASWIDTAEVFGGTTVVGEEVMAAIGQAIR